MLEKTPTPPKAVDFQTRQAQVRIRTRKPDAQGRTFVQGMLPLQNDRPRGGPVLEEALPPQG